MISKKQMERRDKEGRLKFKGRGDRNKGSEGKAETRKKGGNVSIKMREKKLQTKWSCLTSSDFSGATVSILSCCVVVGVGVGMHGVGVMEAVGGSGYGWAAIWPNGGMANSNSDSGDFKEYMPFPVFLLITVPARGGTAINPRRGGSSRTKKKKKKSSVRYFPARTERDS